MLVSKISGSKKVYQADWMSGFSGHAIQLDPKYAKAYYRSVLQVFLSVLGGTLRLLLLNTAVRRVICRS